MEKEKKDKIDEIWERVYPIVISLLITCVYYFSNIKLKDSFSDLLSATMNFASIMLGFVGVLIALLFSLNKNIIKDYIFKDNYFKNRMQKFFHTPIRVGFCFIFFSLIMYLKQTLLSIESLQKIMPILFKLVKISWVFLFLYFTLSSYRLIHIVLKIAFDGEIQEDEDKDETNDKDKKDAALYEEAKREHAASIE